MNSKRRPTLQPTFKETSHDMHPLILHHYDFSNYAEKVRLALGYKSLAWCSVEIPSVAPKPDLQALTGGYRRTPVLQIGADIYCDTRLILRKLDELEPTPTLYPPALMGEATALAYWAETQLFRPISLYVSGRNPEVYSLELQADRAKMRGLPPPSAEAMARAARRNAPHVRVQLPVIEQLLADGREWILGEATSFADFAVYHALWFITGRTQRLAFELDGLHHTQAWMARMRAFGHGERRHMTPATALAIAAQAEPAAARASARFDEDPALGARVRIRADDYARDAVDGVLAYIDAHEIAVARVDAVLGNLVVHFPRLGYDLRAL